MAKNIGGSFYNRNNIFFSMTHIITNEQVQQIKQVLCENTRLKKELIAEKQKYLTVKATAKTILLRIIDVMLAYYKSKSNDSNDFHNTSKTSLSHAYHAIDPDDNLSHLEEDVTEKIEALFFGSLKSFETVFQNKLRTVSLHDSALYDGFPLVLMNVDGKYYAIIKYRPTHMTIQDFQSGNDGLRLDEFDFANFTNFSNSADFHEHANKEPQPIEFHRGVATFHELCCIRLGLPNCPTTNSNSILIVDTNLIAKFVNIVLKYKAQVKCCFILSGESENLFAYIHIIDDLNNTLLLLPVGSHST